MLEKITTKSLYSKSDFVSCGKCGNILANVDLCDATLLLEAQKAIKEARFASLDLTTLIEKVLWSFEYNVVDDEEEAMNHLLSGDGLIFLEGVDCVVVLASKKYTLRAVMEPPTSGVLRGPREGFIEDLKTNLSLIERRLRSPALKVEKLKLGRNTATNIAVVALENIASKRIFDEIVEKLKKIDVDGVTSLQLLQEHLEPSPLSIFDQVGTTEKPDVVAAKLLEGRVAVFCDGSPLVLTLPYMFLEDIQSNEDYSQRSVFSSFLRTVRYVALMIGVFLPGVFVALEEFHSSVIPLKLLLTMSSASANVPFPPFAEILFVLLLFEIIKEAGVRMPQAVGLAMSVVGALVLGDTAVKAGFIGSSAVMIVALSSIAMYTVPNAVNSGSIVRLIFTLLGGFLGLMGIVLGLLFLFLRMVSMSGYGTPYMAPYAPGIWADKKDGIWKQNISDMTTRPFSIRTHNRTRNAVESDRIEDDRKGENNGQS